MRQARRILIFYFFLTCANLVIFFYETALMRMSLHQSLAGRGITLVTDIFEAILFIDSDYLERLAMFVLGKLHIRTWDWVESGLKLAMIGPTIYLVKLLVLDSFLHFADLGIAPIGLDKVWMAYGISLTLSFSSGAAYALFLESAANHVLGLLRKKAPALPVS